MVYRAIYLKPTDCNSNHILKTTFQKHLDMFNKTTGHYSQAKLADKMNHHSRFSDNLHRAFTPNLLLCMKDRILELN